jgi:hypothetical protein
MDSAKKQQYITKLSYLEVGVILISKKQRFASESTQKRLKRHKKRVG